jgi:hypothetical protein
MGFAFLLQLRQQMVNIVPRWGSWVHGKAPNKNRQRDAGALLLYSDYFADNAINTSKEFRQRFRMTKELFMKIVQDVREYDDFGEAILVCKVPRGSSEGCRAGIWCASGTFCRFQVPSSYLVGISDVGREELLRDLAQHNY